ncbi:hypothetical protein DH2020_006328 [Rehmannia glutinosa]|uniref:Arf-GAP domain-containing protein n=1 Tax=Rehmannia glutinosa TaxID=99300 RepID=A0ABR0XIK7_REHGL
MLLRGGNQRARELFLKAWDPQRNKLPDNSNIDKIREFIKNVYVDKIYFLEKSSDRPPRDPQSLRSHEDETRRASSYHSYSQSPPYDFQYEERRYGKHAPALTRKPGSDRGLYEGKLASFLSPTRLSDHAEDLIQDSQIIQFLVEVTLLDLMLCHLALRETLEAPLVKLQEISQANFRSFIKFHIIQMQRQEVMEKEYCIHRSCFFFVSAYLITASSGSFGSFDNSSMSFKSVNSLNLREFGSETEQSAKVSLDKSSSFPSVPHSSVSKTFDELDLFSAPFAPQNAISTPPSGSNTQLAQSSLAQSVNVVQQFPISPVVSEPEQSVEISHEKSSSFPSLPQSSASTTFDGLDLFSTPFAPQTLTSTPLSGSNTQGPSSLAQSVNVIQQFPISSVPTFTRQQSSQTPQPSPLDLFVGQSQLQPAASSNENASDVVMSNNGGWAMFDMPQNMVPTGTQNSAPATVLSSDGNVLGSFNPFSIDQSSSYIDSAGHEPSALSTRTFGHENLQNVEPIINQTHSWSAFDDSAGGQPIQNVIKSNKHAAVRCASDADKSLGFGVYEALNIDGNVRSPDESEPPSSSLPPHLSMPRNDFPMVAAVAGIHAFATDHKPANPFDLPYDSVMESSNMLPGLHRISVSALTFLICNSAWYMAYLRHFIDFAIINQFWNMSSLQAALPNTQTPPSYVANQSWVFQDSVPSYVPGGVPFDPTSAGSLGFMAGQAPSTQIPNIHAQGPVASIGGNPFA